MSSYFHGFFERYDLSHTTPDLQLLRQVAKAYSNLPYENVTKILKGVRDGSQDKLRRTQEVLDDHLRWNTGGTCFSLCNALQDLLRSCGFDVFIAMADMHYGANIHCAIIVNSNGQRYLLDPGYLLHEPIPLPQVHSSHQTPMNTIVIQNEGKDRYSLFTQEGGIQRWRYRLRAKPTSQEEFEKHWIHSFSLNSMEQIMLTRLNESGRLYYRKDRLELVAQQRRIKQTLRVDESQVLSDLFGLPSDLIQQARKALNR